MNDMRKKMRQLWKPRRQELAEQCVSCPFRDGNTEAWMEILEKLRQSAPPGTKVKKTPINKRDASRARVTVRMDCMTVGEFACHHSVYDTNMKTKPATEHRQCPGASKFFREGPEQC